MHCAFCGLHNNHPVLGPLLSLDEGGETPGYYVHRPCALWSPLVREDDGVLCNVLNEIRRGRQLKCSVCGRRGASLGCRVDRCKETFHPLCAHECGATFFANYLVACKRHAPSFQKREPLHPAPFAHGLGIFFQAHAQTWDPDALAHPSELLSPESAFRTGAEAHQTRHGAATPLEVDSYHDATDKAIYHAVDGNAASPTCTNPPAKRQRTLEAAAARVVRAAQLRQRVLRLRRQSAAALNLPLFPLHPHPHQHLNLQRPHQQAHDDDNDEESFAQREIARRHRGIAKLNPMVLGGNEREKNEEENTAKVRQEVFIKRADAGKLDVPDIACIDADDSSTVASIVGCAGFEDLAGFDSIVASLREMVVLPLLHPDVFRLLNVSHSRGILFHGPPGTGKTLAARALAGELARRSPVPVTFFARKGADCLGKYVGDAERTLRLMFEEAGRRAPSIIFFDELDALVPPRSKTSGCQDQIHASVTSTMLCLMDGIVDRGNVIVIGATNRAEAIDPALRRPGRFDREVCFGLPSIAQRESILKTRTRAWNVPPEPSTLRWLAASTEGYAGADLAALCGAAVMHAAQRVAPQMLDSAMAALERDGLKHQSTGGDGVGERAKENEEDDGGNDPCQTLHRDKQLGQSSIAAFAGKASDGQDKKTSSDGQHAAVLPAVVVHDGDWRAALAAAPKPCSKRDSVLGNAVCLRAPPEHTAPLLVRPLMKALQTFSSSFYASLPRVALHEAVELASANAPSGKLEELLVRCGAVSRCAPLAPSSANAALTGSPRGGQASTDADSVRKQNCFLVDASDEECSTKNNNQSVESWYISDPCCSTPPVSRLLLCGRGNAGQTDVAAIILRLMEGCCSVRVIDFPSLAVEAAGSYDGDLCSAAATLVKSALEGGDSRLPRVIVMPRIESWTTESFSHHDVPSGSNAETHATLQNENIEGGAQRNLMPLESACHASNEKAMSMAWNVAQMSFEGARSRLPTLLLATSELPACALPENLRNWFGSASGRCIEVASQNQDGSEVHAVIERAAEAMRHELADRIALLVLDTLGGRPQPGDGHAKQQPNRSVGASIDATACLGPEGGMCGGNAGDNRRKRGDGEGHRDRVSLRTAPLSFAAPRLRPAELERGKQAYQAVVRFLKTLGEGLQHDDRCWRVAGSKLTMPGSWGSFVDIAREAAAGAFDCLDEFRAAVASVVMHVEKSCDLSRSPKQVGGRDVRYSKSGKRPPRQAARVNQTKAVQLAREMQDEIDAACYLVWQFWNLDDPIRAHALSVARRQQVLEERCRTQQQQQQGNGEGDGELDVKEIEMDVGVRSVDGTDASQMYPAEAKSDRPQKAGFTEVTRGKREGPFESRAGDAPLTCVIDMERAAMRLRHAVLHRMDFKPFLCSAKAALLATQQGKGLSGLAAVELAMIKGSDRIHMMLRRVKDTLSRCQGEWSVVETVCSDVEDLMRELCC